MKQLILMLLGVISSLSPAQENLRNYVSEGTTLNKVQVEQIKNTDDDSLASQSSFATDLQGTLKNFLPLLEGYVEGLDPSDDGKKLKISFIPIKSDAGSIMATIMVHEPEVYEPFKELTPENVRTALADSLKKDFHDDSDMELELSWNLETERFGRRLTDSKTDLIDGIFSEISKEVTDFGATFSALDNALRPISKQVTGTVEWGDKKFKDFGNRRDEVKSLIDNFIKTYKPFLEALKEEQKAHKTDLLGKLVQNQPQLHVTFTYRKRDPFVGPDEWALKGTYEWTRTNLNTWVKYSKRNLKKNSNSHLATWDAFYNGKLKNLDHTARMAINLDYTNIKEVDLQVAEFEGLEEPVHLQQEEIERLKATFSYSKPIRIKEGKVQSRFEIAASYEDYSDDEKLNDRGIVSLTYSQKLTETVTLPLVIRYANHHKYLKDVTDEWSTHFGISYKLDKKSK